MESFKANENLYYYFYWMKVRMDIFWERFEGKPISTDDNIFKEFKFTNVYRCLDRVSQYLIRSVIYNDRGLSNDYDTEDIFWRILLFKHFNRIETWKMLEDEFGDITLDIKFNDIIKFLNEKQAQGGLIYSNAYLLTAPIVRHDSFVKRYGIRGDSSKQEIYLNVFRKSIFENGYLYTLLRSQSLEELVMGLQKIDTIAAFLSMQYALDFNYSPLFNFDENDFNLPGKGAVRGMLRCFDMKKNNPKTQLEILRWLQLNFDELVNLYLGDNNIRFLPGRKPSLADLQNCFCETDKYMRGLGIKVDGVKGTRIKQKFIPSNKNIDYFFPPKWGIEIM